MQEIKKNRRKKIRLRSGIEPAPIDKKGAVNHGTATWGCLELCPIRYNLKDFCNRTKTNNLYSCIVSGWCFDFGYVTPRF